jgi:hypothetical protein
LKTIVLIYPPVAKPGEPPAGVARLAGALRHTGLNCRVIDANIDGLHYLLGRPVKADDTWTRRAAKNRSRNLEQLQGPAGYVSFDRYKRAVADIGRVLEKAVPDERIRVGLANYRDRELSPVSSRDLLKAAGAPEENPFYPYFCKAVVPVVRDPAVTAVGVSLGFLSQALCGFALIGLLKRERPDLRIVLGGGLITSWLRRPGWQNPFGDLVQHMVAGPGEKMLMELLGKTEPMDAPVPDYTEFAKSRYLSPGFVLPYSASSGCYWHRCSFCPERTENNPWNPLPVSKVVSDLKRLIALHRPVLVHLLDNALQPALLKALAAGPVGAPWYGFVRFTPQLEDLSFCRRLRRSGCRMLKLGLESGDQTVLDALAKGTDLAAVATILANLKEAGIATYIYLLFGTPAEDERAAEQTLAFTVDHSDRIGFLNLAVFNLPLNSPDGATVPTREFYAGDLSFYQDFEHPLGWHRARVRDFVEKTFKKHPQIAQIVRRDPPVFTSNHAPFFIPGNQA